MIALSGITLGSHTLGSTADGNPGDADVGEAKGKAEGETDGETEVDGDSDCEIDGFDEIDEIDGFDVFIIGFDVTFGFCVTVSFPYDRYITTMDIIIIKPSVEPPIIIINLLFSIFRII